MPKISETIVVWFSCGAASAVAAKKTLEIYGGDVIRVVNNPVIEEHPDNLRFLRDVEKWLGVEIETAKNPDYPNCSAVEIWDRRKYMSGNAGAPCTTLLKKEARIHWENSNQFNWLVLGFTQEEVKRAIRFKKTERRNLLTPLIDLGISKSDCIKILYQSGITPPKMYELGYPNANCIGCVKATSPTYWNHVRKVHPDIFEERNKQSKRIGTKLARYKGKRVFLDNLPENATGRPMKSLNFECGIFCEES